MIESNELTACVACPLLGCPGLRQPPQDRLAASQTFKQFEYVLARGEQAVVQGQRIDQIFSVLSGVFIRFRLLDDGRRQIINFIFPGDLIGMQAMLNEPMTHGVEALTDARLCAFPREGFLDFVMQKPQLGFDVIWLAAKEEAALEEHLVALGQRNARERIAYLALFLLKRAQATGMAGEDNIVPLTVTQGQIADMLGLSLVHTNRSMQGLRKDGLVRWTLNAIEVPDPEAVMRLVRYDGKLSDVRPFV